MRKLQTIVAAAALLVLLVPCAAALAQEQKVVEVREGEVLRVLPGGDVIIRNTATGEIKRFFHVPENVTLSVNGKPAKLSDLREGMKLQAFRMENVPEPVTITESELAAIPAEAPAAAPAAAPAPKPAPAPAPAPAPEPAPAQLPATASNVPLAGLAGLALLVLGVALGGLRRRLS